MDSSPPSGTLRSAVIWSYALTAGRIGVTTVVTFVLAKLLGPTEFGVLAMALLVLGLAQMLLQDGVVAAIVQRDQLTEDHLEGALVAVLLAGLGFAALMAAVSPLWGLANRTPQLTTVCLALTPVVFLHATMLVPEAVLRRRMRFQAVALRTLASALAGGVAGIGLALAGAGVWALVAQQVVTAVTNAVVLWLISPWRPRRRPRLAGVRDLWRFSAHSTNAGLAVYLSNRADQLLTGLMFGPLAVGIYRLAIRLPEMVLDASARSLQQVSLPALSRLQHDRDAFAARLADLQHVGAVVALPALGLLAGLADPLVDFLGPQWAGAELPLRLLCCYAALAVYGVLLGPALQAAGHPGRLAALAWLRGLLGAAVFLGVGAAMTGRQAGVQAAAIATAAAATQLVVVTVTQQITRRTIGVKPRLIRPTLPAVAAVVGAAGVPLALELAGVRVGPPLPHLLVAGAAGAVAAGILLWLFDRRLRAMVRRRLSRRGGTPGGGPAAPPTGAPVGPVPPTGAAPSGPAGEPVPGGRPGPNGHPGPGVTASSLRYRSTVVRHRAGRRPAGP